MTGVYRLALGLTALLAWTGTACRQVGPLASAPVAPRPITRAVPASVVPPPRRTVDIPPAPPAAPTASAASAAITPAVHRPPGRALPGDQVAWREAPALRPPPVGVGAFLADVESRLPPQLGTQYRDRSRVTWCHETTHGVHAALRNRYRAPAFYPGGGRFALVEAPALSLGEVAAAVPPRLRGVRYQVYLVQQRRDWERDPLYVWDEWVAYNNGTTTALAEGGRSKTGPSDDAVACLELSTYALAVASAARRKGVPVSDQFREFCAWELRRSLGLFVRASAHPAFAWPDRRMEQAWRNGDPFLVEELRALFGDALTLRDLLPGAGLARRDNAIKDPQSD